jgi:hypothetical protein
MGSTEGKLDGPEETGMEDNVTVGQLDLNVFEGSIVGIEDGPNVASAIGALEGAEVG